MQSSALDMYNMALSACHAKGRLTALTDNKKERFECDIWYDVVVRTVQEAAFWPGSKQTKLLTDKVTLTEDSTDQVHFIYSYALPDEYLRPRYLMSYMPFELVYEDALGEIRLHTNDPEARLVLSILQEDVAFWTPGQIMATGYGLAGHVAGPLTGRGELIQKNFNLANTALLNAQAASIDYEDFSLDWVPTTLKARGYSGPEMTAKYIYPFGGLFTSPLNA
jgi:hypothetical protein